MNLQLIQDSIIPVLERLATDDIPNIRFNVAKSYGVLIETLRRLPETGTLLELEKSGKPVAPAPQNSALVQQRILPVLAKLQQDDDVDVRYFATTAASQFHEGDAGVQMQTSP